MSFLYDIFEDHAVVTRYLPEEGINIAYIPNAVDGVPVTEIAQGAFRRAEDLKTVIIPMSLQMIGQEAFANCENLACVGVSESERHSVFPPALRYIGENAFMYSGLLEVSFSSAKIVLDRFCFLGSKVVSAFFLGTEITLKEGAFSESDIQFLMMKDAEIDHIDSSCFAFCKCLQTIRAKKINSVGRDCFRDCTALTEFPAKIPLDSVGDGAFYNCCSLKTEGYFRTMGDLIRAWGVGYMLNETVQQKRPSSSWLPERYGNANFKIANAANRLAERIKNTKHLETTDFMILRVIGSDYHGPDNDWNTIDRFFLYGKNDIRKRFREIWDWNVTGETCAYFVPPCQFIGNLSADEVHRLLQHENSPKPYTIDWDNLELLLNAQLGGDAARFGGATATAFLSCLLDHEIGKTPNVYYDIPTTEIVKGYIGNEACIFNDEECLHFLTWNVLYNRIAIYRELKHAYCQLMCDEEMDEAGT